MRYRLMSLTHLQLARALGRVRRITLVRLDHGRRPGLGSEDRRPPCHPAAARAPRAIVAAHPRAAAVFHFPRAGAGLRPPQGPAIALASRGDALPRLTLENDSGTGRSRANAGLLHVQSGQVRGCGVSRSDCGLGTVAWATGLNCPGRRAVDISQRLVVGPEKSESPTTG